MNPPTPAAPPAPIANESARIQTLRGTACLLLVAFHVVGNPGVDGLRVAGDSPYRMFVDLLAHLRMPLFTFLSGFVYAYRGISPGDGWIFATRKFQRLAIPLLVVSTVFYCVQVLVPGTNAAASWEGMWRIYVFPYAHFWFLQAIILIFALVAFLDHNGLIKSFNGFVGVLGVVLLMHFALRPSLNVFSLQQALYLAPFFFLGLGANRFKRQLWNTPTKFACGVGFAVTFTLYVIACFQEPADLPKRTTLWATALSLSGCLSLMYWIPDVQWLARIGGFSFTIYLYHVFFTAGTRMALNLLGDFNTHTHFVIGLFAGLAGPIVLEVVLRNYLLARRVLLGQA